MENKNQFISLVNLAGSESVPEVDVTNQVLSTLTAKQKQYVFVSDKPLMWVAAISTAIAIPSAIITSFVYNALNSPLTEVMESISWVIQ